MAKKRPDYFKLLEVLELDEELDIRIEQKCDPKRRDALYRRWSAVRQKFAEAEAEAAELYQEIEMLKRELGDFCIYTAMKDD